jgi:hypothetical protein
MSFEVGNGLPPEAVGRAIDRYLVVFDDAAFGAATEITSRFLSLSAPAARVPTATNNRAFAGYRSLAREIER